jgi:nucleoside-diphosphate-sugar epimerase
MAILVTGLGYIGSALAHRLLANGEHVVGLENFFSTPRSIVPLLSAAGDFTVVVGSIDDRDCLERAFAAAEITAVVHLAAQASANPTAAPLAYTLATNVLGTHHVLEACAIQRIPRVVIASSTRVYAPPLPRHVSEQSPIHSPDVVHVSQLLGEALLAAVRQHHADWTPSATAVRIGTVHGVGPVLKRDPRFLAVPQRFCLQAAQREGLAADTGPASLLAFVQLDDVVSGLIHCLATPPVAPVVNLAAEVRSVFEVATVVQQLGRERGLDLEIQVRGRPREFGPRSISSALDATGFTPTGTLETSLGAVLDHYLTAAD